jgi:hypothetical protein
MDRIPELDGRGLLPPGIYATTLGDCVERFGRGSAKRELLGGLLRAVVDAARQYPTIKRVLVWGSFVSAKPEPNDLDYSVVVSVAHGGTVITPEHRRFFVPADARLFYGVDRGYLVLPDYPVEPFAEYLSFLCGTREQGPRGVLEISLREGTT